MTGGSVDEYPRHMANSLLNNASNRGCGVNILATKFYWSLGSMSDLSATEETTYREHVRQETPLILKA